MYERFWKRLIDILLSVIGLCLLLIPMLIVALVIWIEDPGPAIFAQKRVGIHKRYFKLYKFRSMKKTAPRDVPTHLLENSDRYYLKSGEIIRKLSIDELPQLWNILTGDMSIVGPRPALWNQEDLIAERDKYGANDIRPGLTGWAQINGRDELTIPEKARLDGEYVKKKSFSFDCRCFFRTIGKVFRGDGVVDGAIEKTKQETEQTACKKKNL